MTILLWSPSASADAPVAPLVHANAVNGCKLNVRGGTTTTAPTLVTLTCANYTSCTRAPVEQAPCGPFETGGEYTCVAPDGKAVKDNRWVEVEWRAPQKSYVAFSCASLRN
ncbi:hypothetical protein [Amycolatopsis nigrescens]|uniref:hypothetical protein n=1 Tax=Amycolatopsis nigrescens TaxID=381445 RepID=UPI0005918221|nr:hypothetical protein [Amycolatopsis nigrescens]